MKQSRRGTRHPLLVYRRALGRIGLTALGIGAVLALAAAGERYLQGRLFPGEGGILLIVGATAGIGFAAFALLARNMSYVQPYRDHFKIVTPFYRLNVSYKRVHSVRPSSVRQVFPPRKLSWGMRNSIEPFYGETAVVVELSSYPLSPRLLRLFMPAGFFLRDAPGFVLIVPDWVGLSTELDSFRSRSRGRKLAYLH